MAAAFAHCLAMSANEQPPPLPPAITASPRKSISPIKLIVIIVCCVVAVAIALFVALGVTGIAKSNIDTQMAAAKVEVAKIFVNSSLQVPLEAYRMDVSDYPSTSEGLQALVTAPAGKSDRWRGPYLMGDKSKILLDPWGNPYQYRYPGIHNKNGYDVWSKGPDGKDGTADDIDNWHRAK